MPDVDVLQEPSVQASRVTVSPGRTMISPQVIFQRHPGIGPPSAWGGASDCQRHPGIGPPFPRRGASDKDMCDNAGASHSDKYSHPCL